MSNKKRELHNFNVDISSDYQETVLINIGRGDVIDESSLIKALKYVCFENQPFLLTNRNLPYLLSFFYESTIVSTVSKYKKYVDPFAIRQNCTLHL